MTTAPARPLANHSEGETSSCFYFYFYCCSYYRSRPTNTSGWAAKPHPLHIFFFYFNLVFFKQKTYIAAAMMSGQISGRGNVRCFHIVAAAEWSTTRFGISWATPIATVAVIVHKNRLLLRTWNTNMKRRRRRRKLNKVQTVICTPIAHNLDVDKRIEEVKLPRERERRVEVTSKNNCSRFLALLFTNRNRLKRKVDCLCSSSSPVHPIQWAVQCTLAFGVQQQQQQLISFIRALSLVIVIWWWWKETRGGGVGGEGGRELILVGKVLTKWAACTWIDAHARSLTLFRDEIIWAVGYSLSTDVINVRVWRHPEKESEIEIPLAVGQWWKRDRMSSSLTIPSNAAAAATVIDYMNPFFSMERNGTTLQQQQQQHSSKHCHRKQLHLFFLLLPSLPPGPGL